MATAPENPLAPDKPGSGRTFFGGVTLKDFKKLTHTQQLAVMAKWHKKHRVKSVQCQSEDGMTNWTLIKPSTKKKK